MAEKAGFVPNIFLAIAHRPDEFRAFFAYHDARMERDSGLSVGEPKPVMYEMLEEIMPFMPENKPRYLMGVGSPDCLLEGVKRGVDMFDCVLQTRSARNGLALTRHGKRMLRNPPPQKDDL